mgnify:FL=1
MDQHLMLSADEVSVQPLVEPSESAIGASYLCSGHELTILRLADGRAKKDEIIGNLTNMVVVSLTRSYMW